MSVTQKGIKLLFVLIVCLTSCHTQKTPLVEYHYRIKHDTICQIDSITKWHTLLIKGDTVFIHDSIDRWHDKQKIVEVFLHDSIPYQVEVPVYVRKRNAYDRFTAKGFWILLVVITLFVGTKIAKIAYKFYF